MEVPTIDGNSCSSMKVGGEVIAIKKGQWSNKHQDWRAVLCFDNGLEVQSVYWFTKIEPEDLNK